MHAQLIREGITVARCTVERLMKTAGLQGVRRVAIVEQPSDQTRDRRRREAEI